MRRIALAAVLLLAAAPAFAQDEADDPAPHGRRFVVSAVTELDFVDDLDVAGKLIRPEGVLLFDRKRAGFKPLIQLRADFNDAMETSVDEVR